MRMKALVAALAVTLGGALAIPQMVPSVAAATTRKRTVELRSFYLKSGSREAFHRLVIDYYTTVVLELDAEVVEGCVAREGEKISATGQPARGCSRVARAGRAWL